MGHVLTLDLISPSAETNYEIAPSRTASVALEGQYDCAVAEKLTAELRLAARRHDGDVVAVVPAPSRSWTPQRSEYLSQHRPSSPVPDVCSCSNTRRVASAIC